MGEFHLPNGHLLNLQARSRNGKRARPNRGEIGRTTHQERAEMSGGDSGTETPQTTPQKSKPTRLPVLKGVTIKDDSQPKEQTATRQKAHVSNLLIQPKRSFGLLERESPKTTNKEREQYWRRGKDKLEKDSPQPRNKDKHKDSYYEAYRKIKSLATSSRQELGKHKWKPSGKPQDAKGYNVDTDHGANMDVTFCIDDQCAESPRNRQEFALVDQTKERSNGEQNSGLSTDETISQRSPAKTDTRTDSSDNSYPSISPVSGPSTSITEWEDRFVVHMPSAREPNPPTMNAQQIAEFQKSIERVHKEGGSMLDPDTLPSPRTTTPESQANRRIQNEKGLGTLDGQDIRSPLPGEVESQISGSPSHHRYYCPDEVGKPRCSTIWEESSLGLKNPPTQTNSDGSFLGCKEINGPDDINPDEILLFSTIEDRPRVVEVPRPMPRKISREQSQDTQQVTSDVEEKTVVQEEWGPISQNLKHAQCSRLSPKTMCREPKCQKPEATKHTQPAGKENLNSLGKQTKHPKPHTRTLSPDDVFIITPTIRRTLVTMADIKGHVRRNASGQEPASRSAGEIITDVRTRPRINAKLQITASPSGLRRAAQTSRKSSNGPSSVSSKVVHTTSTPIIQRQAEPDLIIEKPRAIRGYIRPSGIVQPPAKSHVESVPTNPPGTSIPTSPPKSGNNAPKATSFEGTPDLLKTCSSKRIASNNSTSMRQPEETQSTAKIIEVAELDGMQLCDQPREDRACLKPAASLNPDLKDDEMQADLKGFMSLETLKLIIDNLLLTATQAHEIYCRVLAHRDSKGALAKLFLNGILSMLEHCLNVSGNLLATFSVYTATGAWPRANEKDFARSLAEFGQAMVYLLILGFTMIVVGRAAGYIVLICSWILWLIRPFALIFGTIGRALLA